MFHPASCVAHAVRLTVLYAMSKKLWRESSEAEQKADQVATTAENNYDGQEDVDLIQRVSLFNSFKPDGTPSCST